MIIEIYSIYIYNQNTIKLLFVYKKIIDQSQKVRSEVTSFDLDNLGKNVGPLIEDLHLYLLEQVLLFELFLVEEQA